MSACCAVTSRRCSTFRSARHSKPHVIALSECREQRSKRSRFRTRATSRRSICTSSLAEAAAIHAKTLDSQAEDYTPNVRIRLEMGRYILAEDYVRALRGATLLIEEVDAALRGRDALLLPSLPVPAVRLGATTVKVGGVEEPVRNITLRLTQLFNITGTRRSPFPAGRTTDGLPIGAQLVGRRGATDDLLSVAPGSGISAFSLGQAGNPFIDARPVLSRLGTSARVRDEGSRGAPVRVGYRLDRRDGDDGHRRRGPQTPQLNGGSRSHARTLQAFFALPPTTDFHFAEATSTFEERR